MVVAFVLGSVHYLVRFLYSNIFISGINYYMYCEVFRLLRVDFIHSIMGHCLCTVFSLLACKLPLCDGVEAQEISQLS
jgi:hypothetical protein